MHPFFDRSSTTSAFFYADSLPSRTSNPTLSLYFDRGEIRFSKGLIDQLDIQETRRVTFLYHQQSWYVARTGQDGFWATGNSRTLTITSKSFTQHMLRGLGYGPGDVARFSIATDPVRAEELALDPTHGPYPLYRLLIDPKNLPG